MNLAKAIKVLKDYIDGSPPPPPGQLKEACQIGMESLEALNSARLIYYYTPIPKLPSENDD